MRRLAVVLVATALFSGCSRGTPPGETLRESPLARAVVDEVRAAFVLRPGELPPSSRPAIAARPASVLGASVAERFVARADGIEPGFAAAALDGKRHLAAVALPDRADRALVLSDRDTGLSVRATLAGAAPSVAEVADGVAVYRGALGGADLLHRATPEGTEDFVYLRKAPASPELRYAIELDDHVAGLRLVEDQLELVDGAGAPRLRVARPWLVDANGRRHAATLEVSGCAVDRSAASPWGREPTPPGARRCEVRVAWAGVPVTYPALLDPAWLATGSMAGPRNDHEQVVLTSGKILAISGEFTVNGLTAACEVYDPASETWAVTGSVNNARRDFAFARLSDGRVFIAGGIGPGVLASTELYDPAAGTWAFSGNLATPRFSAAAFAVSGGPLGRVLVAGGRVAGQVGIASSELYNVAAGTFAPGNPLNTARAFDLGRAVTTAGGTPWVAGGASPGNNFLTSVEKYDQVAGTWSNVAAMPVGRVNFTWTVVSDGRIVAVGGATPGGDTDTAAIYDPVANTWAPIASLPDGSRTSHHATNIPNGHLLVAGGFNGVDGWTQTSWIWDLATNTWTQAGDLRDLSNVGFAMTLVDPNRVLASGGYNGNNFVPSHSTAQLFWLVQPDGTDCNLDADCLSGFCVGGLCCPQACPPGPNVATASCNGGVCGIGSCVNGFGDCDGMVPSGCETALNAIPHCGACGQTCDDGTACTTDLCNAAMPLGMCQHVDVRACGSACSNAIGCSWQDMDGDGLNDVWETNHYVDNNCNGVNDAGDLALPESDPLVPTVYVKWDYMDKAGSHDHRPTVAAMNKVKQAFAMHGGHLVEHPSHVAIPEKRVTTLDTAGPNVDPLCTGPDAVSFYTLKAANFPSELAPVYHYAIFAHENSCPEDTLDPDTGDTVGCSQCVSNPKFLGTPSANTTGIGEIPGNDFMVSLGWFVDQGQPITDEMNAGTFLHELAHNLGLQHGGRTEPGFDGVTSGTTNAKPNYLSVMNYSYQFGIGQAPNASYTATTINPATSYRIDLSGEALPTLDEGTNPAAGSVCASNGVGLDEASGIAGGVGRKDVAIFFTNGGATAVYAPTDGTGIDWNRDSDATDANVYRNISGSSGCGPNHGYADWDFTDQAFPEGLARRFDHMELGFQCLTGNWVDGLAPHVANVELDGPTVVAQRIGYSTVPVGVDVRPGTAVNWVSLASPSLVDVAALGSVDFDPTTVVTATVRFGDVAPVSTSIADVNGDGRADLIARFQMSALQLAPAATQAELTGALSYGAAFGGADAVIVLVGPQVGPILDEAAGYLACAGHGGPKDKIAKNIDGAKDALAEGKVHQALERIEHAIHEAAKELDAKGPQPTAQERACLEALSQALVEAARVLAASAVAANPKPKAQAHLAAGDAAYLANDDRAAAHEYHKAWDKASHGGP